MKTLPPFILENADALEALCRECGVRELSLFGSAASGNYDESRSDLDFLVEFEDPDNAGIAARFMALADGLEDIFAKPVDLVTTGSVRNPIFRDQVNLNRQPLYAA